MCLFQDTVWVYKWWLSEIYTSAQMPCDRPVLHLCLSMRAASDKNIPKLKGLTLEGARMDLNDSVTGSTYICIHIYIYICLYVYIYICKCIPAQMLQKS